MILYDQLKMSLLINPTSRTLSNASRAIVNIFSSVLYDLGVGNAVFLLGGGGIKRPPPTVDNETVLSAFFS